MPGGRPERASRAPRIAPPTTPERARPSSQKRRKKVPMRSLLLLTLAAASPAAAYQAVGTADGQDGKTLYRPPARRVLLMTRQRSGSTSFVMLLDQHPKVQGMGEGMSFSHNEPNLAALGITPADVRRDPTDAVQRVLASCDAPTCVINMHPEHFPNNNAGAVARRLLDGAPYGSIHVVALERNAHDEFASWKKALTTGIWDATPKLQAAHREFGDTACDSANGCWKGPELVNKTSFTDFERQHDAWFREIAALRQHAPLLWLKTEDFFRAPEVSPPAPPPPQHRSNARLRSRALPLAGGGAARLRLPRARARGRLAQSLRGGQSESVGEGRRRPRE